MNKISKRLYFKNLLLLYLSTILFHFSNGQLLTNFSATGKFNEQEIWIKNGADSVTININAPLHLNTKGKTFLILFALPNGNSIEWTKGKSLQSGDDWHYDIQHIGAQTRFIRSIDRQNNYIIAYLMADLKSWPTWKRNTQNSKIRIRKIVDSITDIFREFKPDIILNGHSGGGSFIFGYLDAVEKVPSNIKRICFLDSDYGYEDSMHTNKLVQWLKEGQDRHLFVLAYNDSLVIYNGKPLVSPTGGTWYRSRLMQRQLSSFFSFKTTTDTTFIRHTALKGRVNIILKENPEGKIYHTIQVEKNGFIYSVLSNTKFNRKRYFTYFGERVYKDYISN